MALIEPVRQELQPLDSPADFIIGDRPPQALTSLPEGGRRQLVEQVVLYGLVRCKAAGVHQVARIRRPVRRIDRSGQ